MSEKKPAKRPAKTASQSSKSQSSKSQSHKQRARRFQREFERRHGIRLVMLPISAGSTGLLKKGVLTEGWTEISEEDAWATDDWRRSKGFGFRCDAHITVVDVDLGREDEEKMLAAEIPQLQKYYDHRLFQRHASASEALKVDLLKTYGRRSAMGIHRYLSGCSPDMEGVSAIEYSWGQVFSNGHFVVVRSADLSGRDAVLNDCDLLPAPLTMPEPDDVREGGGGRAPESRYKQNYNAGVAAAMYVARADIKEEDKVRVVVAEMRRHNASLSDPKELPDTEWERQAKGCLKYWEEGGGSRDLAVEDIPMFPRERAGDRAGDSDQERAGELYGVPEAFRSLPGYRMQLSPQVPVPVNRPLIQWNTDDDEGSMLVSERVNYLSGPTGVGKSRVVADWAVRLLADGWSVWFINEEDPGDAVRKLVDAGVHSRAKGSLRAGRASFTPVRLLSDAAMDQEVLERRRKKRLPWPFETIIASARSFEDPSRTLAVVDTAVMAGLPHDGASPHGWYDRVTDPLRRLGMTVIIVDHPPKENEYRLTPTGTAQKGARLDGVVWCVYSGGFSRDGGELVLHLYKDRHGVAGIRQGERMKIEQTIGDSVESGVLDGVSTLTYGPADAPAVGRRGRQRSDRWDHRMLGEYVDTALTRICEAHRKMVEAEAEGVQWPRKGDIAALMHDYSATVAAHTKRAIESLQYESTAGVRIETEGRSQHLVCEGPYEYYEAAGDCVGFYGVTIGEELEAEDEERPA